MYSNSKVTPMKRQAIVMYLVYDTFLNSSVNLREKLGYNGRIAGILVPV